MKCSTTILGSCGGTEEGPPAVEQPTLQTLYVAAQPGAKHDRHVWRRLHLGGKVCERVGAIPVCVCCLWYVCVLCVIRVRVCTMRDACDVMCEWCVHGENFASELTYCSF